MSELPISFADIYKDGSIDVYFPKEKDKCIDKYKKMIECINLLENNKTLNCKPFIDAWDKCFKKKK